MSYGYTHNGYFARLRASLWKMKLCVCGHRAYQHQHGGDADKPEVGKCAATTWINGAHSECKCEKYQPEGAESRVPLWGDLTKLFCEKCGKEIGVSASRDSGGFWCVDCSSLWQSRVSPLSQQAKSKSEP